MNYGKYRQHYCDVYPSTRRTGKKLLPKAAVVVAACWCVFFSGLLLAGKLI